MKSKTKKRLIIWIVILLVIALLGYAAYRAVFIFVGDKAVNMLVENQIETMLDTGEIDISELEALLVDEEDAVSEEIVSSESEDETPSAAKKTPESKSPEKPKTRAEKKEIVQKVSDKVSDSVSDADKIAMTRLITSRLSGGDIKYLMGLASGGLTGEEISAAYRLAKARFNAAELSEIKVFWHRYKHSLVNKN